ncbi:MAG: zf-HC2 domain-containing protein [Acidobacteriota bacterium]
MECREVRELAEAFVSEQLLVETTHAVEAHLDRCPVCRAEVEGVRRLRSAVRSAFAAAPDLAARSDFTTALRQRLLSEFDRVGRPQPVVMPRRRWLALAASGALVAGAAWGWREWTASEQALLRLAAVGDHRFCALTFKLAERPIPLEEAARRFGPIYHRLAALELTTSNLSGGEVRIVERHSCVYDGHRFGHLVVLYKNEKVSVLITADEEAGEEPLTLSPASDGFHVASMHGPRHVTFLVTSLSDDAVLEVSRAFLPSLHRVLADA